MLVCWHGDWISAQMVFNAISQSNYPTKISLYPPDYEFPNSIISQAVCLLIISDEAKVREAFHIPSIQFGGNRLASFSRAVVLLKRIACTVQSIITWLKVEEQNTQCGTLFYLLAQLLFTPGAFSFFSGCHAVLPLQSVHGCLVRLHQYSPHMGHLLVQKVEEGELWNFTAEKLFFKLLEKGLKQKKTYFIQPHLRGFNRKASSLWWHTISNLWST